VQLGAAKHVQTLKREPKRLVRPRSSGDLVNHNLFCELLRVTVRESRGKVGIREAMRAPPSASILKTLSHRITVS